ncbi:MAG TPA: Zn-ribbon domain-containing OB-fold protein [Actinomycetota bacterium]|nr:Zn-ribbon domain-containing OB-fold protein [Actinomycetota bacterium]
MQVGTVVVMSRDGASAAGPPGGASLVPPASRAPEPPAAPGAEPVTVVQTPPFAMGGHPLSDAEFRSATGAVDDAIEARYAWDAGVAVGRFLDGLAEGRILGRVCHGCGRVLVPPRMFCERCFRETDGWAEVEPSGVVQTYSVCHVSWDMQRIEPPELPAVIAIDGSSGGFLHKLGEVAPDDVRIGMAVEAVWKPQAERTGSILDIAYFRPVAEG